MLNALLLPLALASLANAPQKRDSAKQDQAYPPVVQIQRDTTPVTVKLLNTGESAAKAAQDSARIEEEREEANISLSFAIVTAVVSTITLLALASQTRLLSDSIGVMRRQEARMGETVAVMERTAERQLRAYLLLVSIEPRDGPFTLETVGINLDTFFGYNLVINNFGQTPASDVQVNGAWGVFPIGQVPEFVLDRDQIGRTLVGPGQKVFMPMPRGTLSQQDLAKIAAGTHRLYLAGAIEYVDAFNRQRITKFRHVRDRNFHQMGADREGNEAT
ncbi:MAG: hypothetical protein H0T48_14365 [Gemmatimonadaceae bacterium]|nr:hypothetical protein [Gemmatimonadaceae bacterium]